MNTLMPLLIGEWRYWKRSKLALIVLMVGALLTMTSVIVNSLHIAESHDARIHQQQAAETRFVEQPDRHPHRMVHYGHYVFRTPSPLSIIDPGVDAFVGTTIFLEGHRQNSAMFSEQRQSAGLTRFSSVTPGFLLQILAPLLIILIGYAGVSREREAGTLNMLVTQGVPLLTVMFSKTLALFSTGVLIIIPLVVASIWATFQGESSLVSLMFVIGYLLYIFTWAMLVTAVSTWSQKSSTSFVMLVGLWISLCILLPRIASSTAMSLQPSAGKLEADFAVLEELRKLGDGHNASDPAFAKLKSNLLAQYEVDDVEQLPVNFRGVVAQYSEEKLTRVLNRYAQARMDEERNQALIARQFGWLSPAIAMRSYSMRIAGSSLETHHRFLQEAEALRYQFVQGLNKAHETILAYDLDINRSKNEQSNLRARVDASNWQILSEFRFQPEIASDRISASQSYLLQLLLWAALAFASLVYTAKRKQL